MTVRQVPGPSSSGRCRHFTGWVAKARALGR